MEKKYQIIIDIALKQLERLEESNTLPKTLYRYNNGIYLYPYEKNEIKMTINQTKRWLAEYLHKLLKANPSSLILMICESESIISFESPNEDLDLTELKSDEIEGLTLYYLFD